MAGTKEGGLKTAATNKAKYGDDYYAIIGRQGGKNGHTGGFASNRELARRVGAIGGKISKRGPAKPKEQDMPIEEAEKNRLMVAVALKNWRKNMASVLKRG